MMDIDELEDYGGVCRFKAESVESAISLVSNQLQQLENIKIPK